MSLNDLLLGLRRDAGFMANVASWRTLPARPAQYAKTPAFLHPLLRAGLAQRGIERLYTHQAQALEETHAGRNAVIVTPTASGKTLAYHLPVLNALLAEPAARALYFYPTKALAQDQLATLRGWSDEIAAGGGLPVPVGLYDGDTPSGERPRIRSTARLLLTNPDMLHVGILPMHMQWAEFFGGLRVVVIDELHTYRGVFGSHVANVLRRLLRICAHYGAQPQFLCTSATIANPQELAESLTERPFTVIAANGAPQGEKHVLLYNPPLTDAEHGVRRSAVLEAQETAARCVAHGVQTIVFGRSRLTAELLLSYLRDTLRAFNERAPAPLRVDVEQGVRGYRGGYLAHERRAIEAGLRDGSVRAVTATNALELGIDIGRLQAAVLCGYPGSIAALWQQMGRAGRTVEGALAVLVTSGLPIDQYLVQHPEYIFERSPERALVNPDTLLLLLDHMRCAAFELPFRPDEGFGRSPFAADVLALLVEQGDLHAAPQRLLWAGAGSPARAIGLRSGGNDPIAIHAPGERGAPLIIGSVDRLAAQSMVHPGAIYLHEGRTYLVDLLNLEESIARVRPAAVDYYTAVDRDSTLEVLEVADARPAPGAQVAHGAVRVSSQVTSYRRKRRFTHETLGVFPLDFEPQTLETAGYWFSVTPDAQRALAEAGAWFDSVNDYGPNWAVQRQQVRLRDGFRCRQCGAPEPAARQHDVHHVTPFRTFGYVPGVNEAYKTANRLENLILVCRACHQRLEAAVRTRGALDGLAYTLHNLAPLYLMCDTEDLGHHVTRAGETGAPGGEETDAGLTLYENIPAGLGFGLRLYELHDVLLAAAHERIAACPCAHGCPACVGPVLEMETQLDTKRVTLALLAALLGRDAALPRPDPVDDVSFWDDPLSPPPPA